MNADTLAIDGGRPVHPGSPIPLSVVCWDEREQAAVQRVFSSGYFCSVYGEAPEVKALEAEWAERVGARHAVAFSSGTTAQHAALRALDIGPGDEVIVPPLTFISTAYTVLIAGAVPVFADVRRETITIDPDRIETAITPRTRAIVPVHWFGHPADLDTIMSIASRRALSVVEDCAHGPEIRLRGRQAGTFGQIACWSLQQTKLLTAAGDGGLATTDDERLAGRLRQIRDHGKLASRPTGRKKDPAEFVAPYRVGVLGNNYRLTEMQAAFARAQLSKLDEFRAVRGRAYHALREGLADVPGLEFQQIRPDVEISYVYFPVVFPSEAFSVPIERIVAALHAEGVAAHPIGLDELNHVHPLFATAEGRATAPAYAMRGDAPVPPYGPGTQPVAEKLSREIVTLPMHPALTEADTRDIVAAVRKVAAAYRA